MKDAVSSWTIALPKIIFKKRNVSERRQQILISKMDCRE
jgi:hypothetical protein